MATVLVVDDRAANREIARAVLDHGGHHVLEAAEGRQGLALAHNGHPDVVLLDLLMPGMDGCEFVHQLRTDPDTAAIPVLFYTSNYREDEVEPIALTYGVNGVVLKSAEPRELLEAVEGALHQPRPVASGACPEPSWQHLRVVNTKLVENIQALDESNTRLLAIAEQSPVGIVLTDTHAHATYVNARLEQITGIPAADLLGHGWLRCITPEHHAEIHAARTTRRGQRRYRHLVSCPTGHRWLHTLLSAVHDRDGSLLGYLANIDDVTDLVAAEHQRHTAERDRETEARRQVTERLESLARLAGGVAHDFNNLLGVMLASSEFVVDEVHEVTGRNLDDANALSILDHLERIAQAGKRAAHLTHQLLAFGRREIVAPTVVDVHTIIREVNRLISGTIGEHVTITSCLDARRHHVLADESQLCQVLLNLVVNAHDAMPDGGTLLLATTNRAPDDPQLPAYLRDGRVVHLTVTDSGHGMAPDVVERAIEPFFTTKPRGAGSGLGLATSYGIINQLGGHLAIDSSPGAGTTVHLYFPGTDEPTAVIEPTTAHPTGGNETILVVEDEDGLREAAHRILVKAGYQVLTAVNGHDALAVAGGHTGPIHLLLTDVVMAQMDGQELAAELRLRRPETPILYMSGDAASMMTGQGTLESGVTVLSKPFTRTDLLQALRAALNQAHHHH